MFEIKSKEQETIKIKFETTEFLEIKCNRLK